MNSKHLSLCVALCLGTACLLPGVAMAASQNDTTQSKDAALAQKMAAMQQQITALQDQLNALREQQAEQSQAAAAQKQTAKDNSNKISKLAETQSAEKKKSENGIKVSGAMRFQYSYEGYNKGNEHRVGDTDFDIFRLNFSGKVDNIELQAEWRWFQYMSAIKYAWLGYDFNKTSQLQLGITRIPFGNQPYDSHSYFFSSNYYLGLEDTYNAGIEYVYAGDPWNVQLAFFKNDDMGGIDGYVSNRADGYSYKVVGARAPNEGIYADPQDPIATANTLSARVAYTLKPTSDLKVELGASGLRGDLENPTTTVGHYDAYALHMNAFYKRWNVQAQAAHYQYAVGGATRMAVGAYAFYDSIPASADTYTFNVKYHQPVQWGPVHGLDFYNDYSLVTNKSGNLPNTFMNVLGVGVSAGDLYTYFDFLTARNQPFVGGSMAGDGEVEHRFNINFGFYF
ncbi:MAG TPA: carbohydrate porin [Rhodanobacteraceae bacterium]|nr:carbohydrate porin [Rhodanobacteraceae bacterium]